MTKKYDQKPSFAMAIQDPVAKWRDVEAFLDSLPKGKLLRLGGPGTIASDVNFRLDVQAVSTSDTGRDY